MLKENISHKATHNILCIDKTFFKLLFARITQLYREKETIIMAQLLIEIFTEELPALPLLKNLDSIQENWANILKTNDLTSEFSFFYTPRRLTIVHRDFALQQPNKKIQIYGPPIHIAYDENKKPSKALQSFLQKNDITLNDIKIITKNNKEVVLYEKNENGVKSIEILGNMVQSWLMSLNFGKSMRWGNHEESFIRPIRNICILLDSNLVPCHAYGLHTSNNITAHRQAKNNQKTVTNLQSYMSFLANNGVIIDQAIRKNSIIESIQKLEKQHNIQVEIDNDLLDEIVAITEYPTALFGHFDKRFLQIPKEMIITSMKENQRYFAIYKDSQLYNGFIVISNTFGGNLELITKGNEKVLKARLSDAEFFYHNDLKARMQFGNLGDISFMQGAGSLSDKIQREIVLAQYIIEMLNTTQQKYQKQTLNIELQDQEAIIQALQLAKNDLLSQSVGEFPELQGIMGANFAKHCNIQEKVCIAIKEQYLPHGHNANLPSNIISAIVNLSIKVDTLFTLFNLGKIPTGSKDPFALRRQATAILRICHQFGFNIAIQELCKLAKNSYTNIHQQILQDFFTDRIYGIFSNINPSIIRCVLLRNFGIKESFDKIIALSSYLNTIDIKSVISTFKRVANIVNSDNKQVNDINISLFEVSERTLYDNLLLYKKNKTYLFDTAKKTMDSDVFLISIRNLFALKPYLDDVFDSVLINTEDKKLKDNRMLLITLVFNEFLEFGDMREISI